MTAIGKDAGPMTAPTLPICERLRAAVGEGEFFVNGDTFDLIFAPNGTNFVNAHKIVGRFACGETAYTLPAIVAELLNDALSRARNGGQP